MSKPRVTKDRDADDWVWSCKCPEAPLISWPVHSWIHAYSLAINHAKEHHND